jgi:transcriptional regulator with XRE-family HTH domain
MKGAIPMKKDSLSGILKAAIKTSGKTVYRIAQESGVAHPVILRFMSGERDIRLETAEKLADALGLRLTH